MWYPSPYMSNPVKKRRTSKFHWKHKITAIFLSTFFILFNVFQYTPSAYAARALSSFERGIKASNHQRETILALAKSISARGHSLGSSDVEEAREELVQEAQSLFNFLSQRRSSSQEEVEPNFFLLLQNPDIRSYVEFARDWRSLTQKVPVVISGGVGRGTVGLRNGIAQYNQTQLDEESRFVIPDGADSEAEIIQHILMHQGVPRDWIYLEENSTNTPENFVNSLPILETLIRERDFSAAHIQIIGQPPLNLRVHQTALKKWTDDFNQWREDSRIEEWSITTQSVEPSTDLSVLSDEALEKLLEYVLGYPQEAREGESHTDGTPFNRESEMERVERYSRQPYKDVEYIDFGETPWNLPRVVSLRQSLFKNFLRAAQRFYSQKDKVIDALTFAGIDEGVVKGFVDGLSKRNDFKDRISVNLIQYAERFALLSFKLQRSTKIVQRQAESILELVATQPNLEETIAKVHAAVEQLDETRYKRGVITKKVKQSDEIKKGIVSVEANGDLGSGIYFAQQQGEGETHYLFLTSGHVVEGHDKANIFFYHDNGRKRLLGEASVVLMHSDEKVETSDLAILAFSTRDLEMPKSELPIAVLEMTSTLNDGDLATLVNTLNKSVSTGQIVRFEESLLLLGADIIEGDSGSPIILENQWAGVAARSGAIAMLLTQSIIERMEKALSQKGNYFNLMTDDPKKIQASLDALQQLQAFYTEAEEVSPLPIPKPDSQSIGASLGDSFGSKTVEIMNVLAEELNVIDPVNREGVRVIFETDDVDGEPFVSRASLREHIVQGNNEEWWMHLHLYVELENGEIFNNGLLLKMTFEEDRIMLSEPMADLRLDGVEFDAMIPLASGVEQKLISQQMMERIISQATERINREPSIRQDVEDSIDQIKKGTNDFQHFVLGRAISPEYQGSYQQLPAQVFGSSSKGTFQNILYQRISSSTVGQSLGVEVNVLDSLKESVTVFMTGEDVEALSLGQLNEIFKLAFRNPKQLQIVIANAGRFKHALLNLPNIHFTPRSLLESVGLVRKAKHNLFLSKTRDAPTEFTLVGQNRFRYADDEEGLLGVALLYTQAKNKALFLLKFGLSQIKGYFSLVEEALLAVVQSHLANLITARAA